MAVGSPIILDDRLLIEGLLVGVRKPRRSALFTTAYWYYRACRAAVLGGGGHLAGPFGALGAPEQEQALLSLLDLREDISLPDPRSTVPLMADLARRHPRLNLINLEAAAAGQSLDATLWLSRESAVGVLTGVLDQEGIEWQVVAID